MLEDVKGIGPKSAKLLNKLDIYTIDDLLEHYPFRYELIKRSDLEKVEDQEKVIYDGKVASNVVVNYFNKVNKLSFRLANKKTYLAVSIFNRAFLKKNLKIGTSVVVVGKFDKKRNTIVASDIYFETLGDKEKIKAIYHFTSGITQKQMAKFINNAYLIHKENLRDLIPDYYQNKYDFYSKKLAINIVHNPPDKEKLKKAIRRLKYEELFEFMFKINYLKLKREEKKDGIKREEDFEKIKKAIDTLEFDLTKDQLKTLKEILNDLKKPRQMNRILQGDVGSGKTIVAFLASYYNYLSGYQTAIMAPTEILAIQHYHNFKELKFAKNMNIELLRGKTTKKEKERIYQDLKSGKIDIVIGTHALIEDSVEFKNLGFVITDEQHRFGVNQRKNLRNKALKPDILFMSATPIPRTYALTIYGDMDVSSIKEMPKGRKEIKTIVKSEKEIKDVLKLMHEELEKGHQIYVISPLIEESDKLDLKNITEIEENMNKAFGSKYNIEVMHGKMKPQEKELVMQEFKANKIDILVSTTVIEVGVDVPNATMMVIYDAYRFGLSTLHQLRGRVGRSNLESTCILISNKEKKRLNIMETTHDGFKISEEDFKLRGAGEIFGTKQSGDMNFKLASLTRDLKILLKVKEDSLEYLENPKYNEDILKKQLIESINNN